MGELGWCRSNEDLMVVDKVCAVYTFHQNDQVADFEVDQEVKEKYDYSKNYLEDHLILLSLLDALLPDVELKTSLFLGSLITK